MKERVANWTAGLPQADQKLPGLLRSGRDGYLPPSRTRPAARRCSRRAAPTATKVGRQGAKVGPQLDGIGLRRRRAPAGDTLDPNRNVDPGVPHDVLN